MSASAPTCSRRLNPILLEPWQTMLSGYAKEIVEAAVIHTPRECIETKVIREPSTVANPLTRELTFTGRFTI